MHTLVHYNVRKIVCPNLTSFNRYQHFVKIRVSDQTVFTLCIDVNRFWTQFLSVHLGVVCIVLFSFARDTFSFDADRYVTEKTHGFCFLFENVCRYLKGKLVFEIFLNRDNNRIE